MQLEVGLKIWLAYWADNLIGVSTTLSNSLASKENIWSEWTISNVLMVIPKTYKGFQSTNIQIYFSSCMVPIENSQVHMCSLCFKNKFILLFDNIDSLYIQGHLIYAKQL